LSEKKKPETKAPEEKPAQQARRTFLKYAATAVVAGAVAAGAAYYAGPARAPPPTPPTTVTVTAPQVTVPKTKPPVESIRLGRTAPITGFLAGPERLCAMWINLWLELVNAKGGVYMEEYGQKLPIGQILYNDRGETETAIRNIERLVNIDKAHLIWGSYGTFQGFAMWPVVNQLKIPSLIPNAAPIVVDKPEQFEDIYLKEDYFRDTEGRPWMEWNYLFWPEMSYYWEMEALYRLLKQLGVSTVAILQLETLFGVENRREFVHFAEKRDGISVLLEKTYPFEIKDFGPIITELQAKKPDAVLQFGYPDDGWLSTLHFIEKNYNPPFFYNALGMFYEEGFKRYGENLEGICGHGEPFCAASKMATGPYGTAKDAMEMYYNRYGEVPDFIDGSLAFACGEIIEQLLERAGSLDPEEIHKAIIATKDNPIPTIVGPTSWHRGPWSERPGTILQFINVKERGPLYSPEVVSAAYGETAGMPLPKVSDQYVTAKPLYPKPAWKR